MKFREGDSVDYEALTDEALLEKLDNWDRLDRFEDSEEWRIFDEACRRVAMRAREELIKVPANDTLRIIELQQIIKLYGSVFKSLMSSFKQEGEVAFFEARDRGLT